MPVEIERTILSADYSSNCYLVRAEPGGPIVAVIDPGGDVTGLLERDDLAVEAILVTHSDIDHVAGVAALAAATSAPVWAPADEADFLRAGRTRTGHPFPSHEPEHLVRDGDTVTVAGIAFDVVGIPGHSADHVAFCIDGNLFSGDLLFAGSVGRTDLPGGDWPSLVASVERLHARYGADGTVYPGHGEPTTLGHEVETNPFLGEMRVG